MIVVLQIHLIWAVAFGTARRGLGGAAARPGRPLLAVPNVIAGIPITVFAV